MLLKPETDVWADIIYAPDTYKISTNGIVFSKKRNLVKKPYIDRWGYECYCLWVGGKLKNFKTHRLLAIHFLKTEKPESLTVNHKDGNKRNNSLSNLEWMSASENVKHAFRTGLIKNLLPRNKKIKNDDVKTIKSLRLSGLKLREIAIKYGITESNVSMICLGKTWK